MKLRSSANLVFIYDTETTGLLPKVNKRMGIIPTLDQYPYIVQISFIIFNIATRQLVRKFNTYIKIPDNIVITDEITKLTGATRELCDNGMHIVNAFNEFYHAYSMCDYVIAHNMKFDSKMMKVELQRNKSMFLKYAPHCLNIFNREYEEMNITKRYCTMMSSIHICNIICQTNGKAPFKKFPKLSELYYHLFHTVPENLHNSMIDTLVCLRCYLKIHKNIDMDDRQFQSILENALV